MESHQRRYVKSFVKPSASQSNYSMRNKRQSAKPSWRGPLDARSQGQVDLFSGGVDS